ncbi:MAG: hypothetical protein P4L35_01685 [Ignavibacteriaceae bacterium]|nr:hypothetical protein [Ignavibacteriaceae bacterium]
MKCRKIYFTDLIVLLAALLALQSCGRNKDNMQTYVNNYTEIIKELRNQSRQDIIIQSREAVKAYRMSGFTDIDNAEKAKSSLLERVMLDSISLQKVRTLKTPDQKSDEITKNLMQGINQEILGNIIFASNYSKAKDQNIQERKETILNIRPGMRFLAEGLNSIVTSIESMQAYLKDNNLKGDEEIAPLYLIFKSENDNIKAFLKN